MSCLIGMYGRKRAVRAQERRKRSAVKKVMSLVLLVLILSIHGIIELSIFKSEGGSCGGGGAKL